MQSHTQGASNKSTSEVQNTDGSRIPHLLDRGRAGSQHVDGVSSLERGQAVRDDEGGAAPAGAGQGLLHMALWACVWRGGGGAEARGQGVSKQTQSPPGTDNGQQVRAR